MYDTKRLKRNAYKAYFFLIGFPLVLRVIWELYLSEWVKEIWVEVQWRLDFYVGYMLSNPNRRFKYHRYMLDKWGDRYRDRFFEQD